MVSQNQIQQTGPDCQPVPSGKSDGGRKACPRQVFASIGVAVRFAIALETWGMVGLCERCRVCGLIHVTERKFQVE